jgi:hypothetical protein
MKDRKITTSTNVVSEVTWKRRLGTVFLLLLSGDITKYTCDASSNIDRLQLTWKKKPYDTYTTTYSRKIDGDTQMRITTNDKISTFPYCVRGGGSPHAAGRSNVVSTYPPSPFEPPNFPAVSRRLGELVESAKRNGLTFINSIPQILDNLRSEEQEQRQQQQRQQKQYSSRVEDVKKESDLDENLQLNGPSVLRSATFSEAYGDSSSQSSSLSTSTMKTTSHKAAILSSFLSPVKIVQICILAFGLAELLDRMGVLYEDTPEVIKSQLDAWWQLDIEPFLLQWTDKARTLWVDTIASHIGVILGIDSDNTDKVVIFNGGMRSTVERALYRTRYFLKQAFFNTKYVFENNDKVAFAVGTAMGMVGAPVACSWVMQYTGIIWKPVVAAYAAAEAHHWCKINGIRSIVDWLGDTPQTLGSVLDDLLERWRWWVRKRTPWGTADCNIDSSRMLEYNKSTHHMIRLQGSQPSSPASATRVLGGGSVDGKKKNKKRSSHTEGNGSYTRDLQELVEDFKEWMVVNQHDMGESGNLYVFDESSRQSSKIDNAHRRQARRRNKFIKQGFALGCLLGLAMLDRN